MQQGTTEIASSPVPISTQKSCESQQPPGADRTSEEVIREWFARFAANCGQAPSEFRLILWLDELGGIESRQLEQAFRCVMRRHTFNNIPQVGEIHVELERVAESSAAMDDELAWQQVLEHCRRYVWRDAGRTGPRRSDAIEFAVRCADGWFYLADCSEHDLVFAKQRFLTALGRWRDGAENFALLPEGPAKKLIAGLAERKQLPGTETWEKARSAGESYRERLGEYSAEVRRLTASAKKNEAPRLAIATSPRLELLERQKAELLAKCSPDEVRRAEQLRARCERGAR